MKITKFDQTNLRMISEDLKTALKSIEEKYGITLTYKGSRYDPTTATIKIEGVVFTSDGVAMSKERQDFVQYHSLFNIPKEILDQEINYSGESYLVTGLAVRSSKFPVMAKRISDGKGFKLSAEGVKTAWERKNKN